MCEQSNNETIALSESQRTAMRLRHFVGLLLDDMQTLNEHGLAALKAPTKVEGLPDEILEVLAFAVAVSARWWELGEGDLGMAVQRAREALERDPTPDTRAVARAPQEQVVRWATGLRGQSAEVLVELAGRIESGKAEGWLDLPAALEKLDRYPEDLHVVLLQTLIRELDEQHEDASRIANAVDVG